MRLLRRMVLIFMTHRTMGGAPIALSIALCLLIVRIALFNAA